MLVFNCVAWAKEWDYGSSKLLENILYKKKPGVLSDFLNIVLNIRL